MREEKEKREEKGEEGRRGRRGRRGDRIEKKMKKNSMEGYSIGFPKSTYVHNMRVFDKLCF